jgi:hypothetical protein
MNLTGGIILLIVFVDPTDCLCRYALVRQATQRCSTKVPADLGSRDGLHDGESNRARHSRRFHHHFSLLKFQTEHYPLPLLLAKEIAKEYTR